MRKESGTTLSFLARIYGLMELSFTEMGKTKRNKFKGKLKYTALDMLTTSDC